MSDIVEFCKLRELLEEKPKRTRQNTLQGWRIIGGKKHFYRSKWEMNYARFLEFRKQSQEIKDWLYEPETFWFEKIKRGTRSYLPDFKIIEHDDSFYFVEVKGYMDQKSKTKLKRMKKYYPEIKIVLVQADWFKKNRNYKLVIKDWE